MALQFMLGRSYADKEEAMIDDIAELLYQEEDIDIYYLVPDHMKFESELNVLQCLHRHDYFKEKDYFGMIQLQVLSFSRLAWYLLQDQPIFNQVQLTDSGLSMLIQKLLIEHQDRLQIYRGEVYQQGFIHKLRDLFREFRQGQLVQEDLESIIDSLPGEDTTDQTFAQKLEEITFIYERYNEVLLGKYIEKEDVLDALKDHFDQGLERESYVYINHFNQFTAQEQELILSFIENTRQTTLGLTLDQSYRTEQPDDQDVFYVPGRTYHKLYQACRQRGLQVRHDRYIHQEMPEEFDSLEEVMSLSQVDMLRDRQEYPANESIELWRADSRHAEVLHTATSIRRLVHQEGYRYQDILVMSRKIEDYQTIIDAFFERNEIPLFIDHSDKMIHHPFAQFIQLLLDIYRYRWQRNDALNLLKTELFLPVREDEMPRRGEERTTYLNDLSQQFRERVDLLENYVLQYGIQNYEWQEEWAYVEVEDDLEMQEAVNETRSFLVDTLQVLYRRLDRAGTNEEASRFIYQFLEASHVREVLLSWRDRELEGGQLEKAREYEQVWTTFIDLIDEFVEILGGEEWSIDLFYQVLTTGLEQTTYSNVPPAIDQIIFTQLTSQPPRKTKVVFILGLDDDALPLQVSNDSLLSDEDREVIDHMTAEEIYLSGISSRKYAEEAFIAYRSFTQAKEKLYLSYTCLTDENHQIQASAFYKRLEEALRIETRPKSYEVGYNLKDRDMHPLDFIGSQTETAGQVLSVLREAMSTRQKPQNIWLNLYHYFSRAPESNFRELSESLDYQNIPVNLSRDVAEGLYGKNLHLSVSQLETYYLDPYSHFLQHGLRLRERKVMDLTALETGEFFHESLELVVDRLKDEKRPIQDFSDSELEAFVDEIHQDMLAQTKYAVFSKSGRMNFMFYQLRQTIERMVWAMKEQTSHSEFKPVATEVTFGRMGTDPSLETLSYPLANGGEISIRGKIDRVDEWEINNAKYFNIIDYKSSSHDINYKDIYHGLAIQLMTYFKVILHAMEARYGDRAKPGGAFYSHVHNSFLTIDKPLGESKLQDEKIKKHRLEGLFVADEQLFDALAERLNPGEDSLAFKMKRLQKGHLGKFKQINPKDLGIIFNYIDYLIEKAGNEILQGKVDLRPYDKKDFIPSVKGPFRAVSQFDAMLPENNYFLLPGKDIQDMKELLDKERKRDE